MRYFIIAGETSGQRIANALIDDLISVDNDAQVSFWFVDALASIQTTDRAQKQIKASHSMGFVEVITSLPRHLLALKKCKAAIAANNPDVVILVDNAGWNMHLLPWLKKNHYKNIYLIPPKTWASRRHREKALHRYCDLLIAAYEFEYEYFKNRGLPCLYFGHPYLSEWRGSNSTADPKKIAILPGSRPQEVNLMMPILSKVIKQMPRDYKWQISLASGIKKEQLLNHIDSNIVMIKSEPINEWLSDCSMAIVTSGTASIEVAALNVPQIVCYRMHPLTYLIARRLITAPYISLPNLILNKPIVPELIQNKCTPNAIIEAIENVAASRARGRQLEGYQIIQQSLRKGGPFDGAAKAIMQVARQ